MIFHDATCGRARSMTRRIADAIKTDCPCCSIWRALLAGLALGLLGSSFGFLGLAAVVGVVVAPIIIDVVRALPSSSGDQG